LFRRPGSIYANRLEAGSSLGLYPEGMHTRLESSR